MKRTALQTSADAVSVEVEAVSVSTGLRQEALPVQDIFDTLIVSRLWLRWKLDDIRTGAACFSLIDLESGVFIRCPLGFRCAVRGMFERIIFRLLIRLKTSFCSKDVVWLVGNALASQCDYLDEEHLAGRQEQLGRLGSNSRNQFGTFLVPRRDATLRDHMKNGHRHVDRRSTGV